MHDNMRIVREFLQNAFWLKYIKDHHLNFCQYIGSMHNSFPTKHQSAIRAWAFAKQIKKISVLLVSIDSIYRTCLPRCQREDCAESNAIYDSILIKDEILAWNEPLYANGSNLQRVTFVDSQGGWGHHHPYTDPCAQEQEICNGSLIQLHEPPTTLWFCLPVCLLVLTVSNWRLES